MHQKASYRNTALIFAHCFHQIKQIQKCILEMKKIVIKSIKTNLLQNAFSLIVIVFQQTFPRLIILKMIFSKSAKKCELIFQRVLQGCKMNIFRYTRTCANMCKKSKLPFCGISTLENKKIDYLFKTFINNEIIPINMHIYL